MQLVSMLGEARDVEWGAKVADGGNHCVGQCHGIRGGTQHQHCLGNVVGGAAKRLLIIHQPLAVVGADEGIGHDSRIVRD